VTPPPGRPMRARPDPSSSWRQGYPEEVLRAAWTPVIPLAGRPAATARRGARDSQPLAGPPPLIEGLPEQTAL
jgi:hypothetical protein